MLNRYEEIGNKIFLDKAKNHSKVCINLREKISKEAIETLRSIMEDEFFNVISEYYNREISNSKKYEERESLHL